MGQDAQSRRLEAFEGSATTEVAPFHDSTKSGCGNVSGLRANLELDSGDQESESEMKTDKEIIEELLRALRMAHDHLLFKNQEHTRTWKVVEAALNEHDPKRVPGT